MCYYRVAICYARLGRYERSIYPFSRCIEICPDTQNYHMERGKAYQSLQMFEEALVDFDIVIELNPKNAHAYFRRAFAYKALKRFKEAAEDFDKAKTLDLMNPLLVVNHKHLKKVNFLEICIPGEEKTYLDHEMR